MNYVNHNESNTSVLCQLVISYADDSISIKNFPEGPVLGTRRGEVAGSLKAGSGLVLEPGAEGRGTEKDND